MFADLNRYAVRPSRSIGVLYDHRDDRADLVRLVVNELPMLKNLIELERTTLSARSRRLYLECALHRDWRPLIVARNSFHRNAQILRYGIGD